MIASGRAAVALVSALALVGCATTAPIAPGSPPADARSALLALTAWHANGRVAVKTANDGWSAGFEWREADERGEVNVRGPFGAGSARITRTPTLIRIEQGSAPPIDVPAPFDALEATLVERLGVPLPLTQLRWWLIGVAAPGVPSVGDAAAFEQSGWRVQVNEYTTVPGAPAPLPRRLVLERDATRVRVIVDRWDLVP